MSLLASAGIYLVLDVNSPLLSHHLNRYEPWTSYNVDYMTNVFKVVNQFSAYNNTLGFFAGNEIVNDEMSAKVCISLGSTLLELLLTLGIAHICKSSYQRYEKLYRI